MSTEEGIAQPATDSLVESDEQRQANALEEENIHMENDNVSLVEHNSIPSEIDTPQPSFSKEADDTLPEPFPFLSPPPPSGVAPGLSEDEDDFGDFGDFSTTTTTTTAPPVAAPLEPAPEALVPADDDFGDFDDFAQPPAAAPPQAVSDIPLETSLHMQSEEQGDPAEEERVARIVLSQLTELGSGKDIFNNINSTLAKAFPVGPLPKGDIHTRPIQGYFEEENQKQSKDEKADSNKTIRPNSAFNGTSWYNIWEKLSSETIYTETIGIKFRWRKSHIRKAFLQALDININPDETPRPISTTTTQPRESVDLGPLLQTPASPLAKGGSSTTFGESDKSRTPKDSKEVELIEARKLCDIPEDEIRKKSEQELRDLVHALTSYHQKMQDQANYWLDSKEQLIMDAEMHNKMIASLVQYAQQQQTAPKAPRSNSPGKKGKGVGSTKR